MEFEYALVGPESRAALRKADDGGWLRLPEFFDASENVNVVGPKITQEILSGVFLSKTRKIIKQFKMFLH